MEQKLGRYVIEEMLGEGSFAYVYRAKDENLDRHVAMKILKPIWMSDPIAVGRFKQEARTMAKLDKHAHIAVVYEVGEAEGQVYLTQLLVDGETLADKVAREGPMAWPEVVSITHAIASALDYAHGQGVVHRDIKPANILLEKDGTPYLGDFGLVRAAESSESVAASVVGVKGTASYIPPEVWDEEEATAVSDVYALTCVVSEMLTGQVLFEGSSMMQVMRHHDRGPEFPDTWPEGIPAGVTKVLQQGLAANPKERIQSAGELAAALAALSDASQLKEAAETIPTPPPAAATETVEPVAVVVAEGTAPQETVEALSDASQPEEVAEAVPTPAPAVVAKPVEPEAAAVVETTAAPETVKEAPSRVTLAPAAEPAAPVTQPPAEKSNSRTLMIAGAVVVVLIIACIAGSFLLPGDTEVTAPAADTQSGQSSAASDAEEAPTQPPIRGSAATPPPDTSAGSTENADIEILYSHGFDAESAEWPTGQDEISSGQLSAGSYLITVTGDNFRAFPAIGLEFDDFELQIEATPVEHSGEYIYGLIFRNNVSESNFYQVQIEDNLFSVWLFKENQFTQLSEFIEVPAINVGGPNTFGVDAFGPDLAFFINDEHIITIQDNTLQSGTIGLYVESFDAGAVSIAFDNVLVWK